MPPNYRLPLMEASHLNVMRASTHNSNKYSLRRRSEPSPPPIQDPIDPPENPDVPVREPDPDLPNQI